MGGTQGTETECERIRDGKSMASCRRENGLETGNDAFPIILSDRFVPNHGWYKVDLLLYKKSDIFTLKVAAYYMFAALDYLEPLMNLLVFSFHVSHVGKIIGVK